ncbi:MAG: hypothetical protein LBH02_03000, partial [Methanocalculaceae archaeon]|nr:hypothetical protein [Methanocalculaceae archaeon]
YFEGTIAAFEELINMSLINEDDSDLNQIKTDLLNRKKILAEFFSTHKIGDILTDATPTQHLAQLESINADGNDEIQKTATEKFVNSLIILGTLEDNELLKIEKKTSEYTLSGMKDPKELRVMYAHDDFSDMISENLDGTGIINHIRTSSTTGYVITTGSEIVLAQDIDDLGDILDHLGVDNDEAIRFVDAIFFKRALIEKIHDLTSNGITTEAGLLEAFETPSFPLGETENKISFDISADYLAGVVNDLRKQGFLKGRDGKIKSR